MSAVLTYLVAASFSTLAQSSVTYYIQGVKNEHLTLHAMKLPKMSLY